MSDLIFRISPNVVLGSYTLTRLGQFAKEYGKRFVVILDPILKEVNVAEKILQPLKDANIDFFVFSEITESANTKTIARLLPLARDGRADGIIAAGGAKVLNLGLALAALYNETNDLYDFVDGKESASNPIPLICVPTTIREPFVYMNRIPVIDSRNSRLTLLKTQNALCSLALLDPNVTLTLSENQSAAMMLETLCLAFEAYLSQKATFFSDMFIEKSAELMGKAFDNENGLESTTAAEILKSQAGFMASLGAAASSVGLASLLALCINARFTVSRSLILSILFPYLIEDAGKFKSEKVEKFAHLSHIVPSDIAGDAAVEKFAISIRSRLATADLPARLKDLSVSVEQLARCAEDARALDIANSLPRSMTSDEIFEFAKRAF